MVREDTNHGREDMGTKWWFVKTRTTEETLTTIYEEHR
jgi:hypothetical protein